VQTFYGKSSNEIVYGTAPATVPRSRHRVRPWPDRGRGLRQRRQNCAYNDSSAANQAGSTAPPSKSTSRHDDAGGGFNIGWVTAGEYLTYTVNVATAATTSSN